MRHHIGLLQLSKVVNKLYVALGVGLGEGGEGNDSEICSNSLDSSVVTIKGHSSKYLVVLYMAEWHAQERARNFLRFRRC